MKSLSMLEHLVEPDHRRVVELYPLCHSYTILCAKERYYNLQSELYDIMIIKLT